MWQGFSLRQLFLVILVVGVFVNTMRQQMRLENEVARRKALFQSYVKEGRYRLQKIQYATGDIGGETRGAWIIELTDYRNYEIEVFELTNAKWTPTNTFQPNRAVTTLSVDIQNDESLFLLSCWSSGLSYFSVKGGPYYVATTDYAEMPIDDSPFFFLFFGDRLSLNQANFTDLARNHNTTEMAEAVERTGVSIVRFHFSKRNK